MSDYNELLLDAYSGELFGDALFGALAERFDGERRAKLRSLQTIEARTAAALRQLVDDAGVDAGNDDATRAQGRAMVEGGELEWEGFLRALHDALPQFLANFVRLRELAADPHDPALHALVEHEQTISAFAQLELSGASDVSHFVLTRYLESAP